MNSGIQVVPPDQRTLPANPERTDLCEGCDRYIEHSCTSPRRASSRDAPASPATASTDPAPSPSQEAYTTVKQGLGTPRAPHFDDVPVVTWVGPDGGSDDADAIDEFALPVPGIPDSKAPNSR